IHGMPHNRINSSVDDSLVPFFLKPNDWHGKGVDFHRKRHDPPARAVKGKSEKRNEPAGFWHQMEPKDIKRNKDDLPHIRDHQQNYENSVPQRLSFLDKSSGTLREQAGVIGQDAEDGHGHHGDGNGEKHPCAPPVQRASRHKEQESVKRDVEENTSNDFWNEHRVFKKCSV